MTDQKSIEQLSDEYCDLWRHSPTSVEEFLSKSSSSNDSSSNLIIRLIKHEIELRRSAGENCSADEYQKRFPHVDPEVMNNLFSMPAPPPVSVLKPLLPKRYQPIKQIGKGGIGSVWQVNDREMERTLAVKVLHSKLEKEMSANLRLKREAMLTGSLQHPGIPPVFEYGSLVGGSKYFAMKLVEGETLDKAIPKQSQSELLAIFQQIAEAVGFAHSRNVIHRDLKPQNIMVGAFGEVQIMDWGLAKDLNTGGSLQRSDAVSPAIVSQPQAEIETGDNSIDSSYVGSDVELTRHGDVVGTPAYMSPEQSRGDLDQLGPATDVYALGAMLFEILTGYRWYRVRPDETEPAKVNKVLNANLDSDEIANPLAMLCKQCLQPNQKERPADGSAVAQLVGDYQSKLAQRLQETEIDRAKAEAMTEEVRKRSRLRLGMLAAILLTGLMGIAAVAWYQIDQANKRSAILSDFEIANDRIELFRDRSDFESAEKTAALIESKTDRFGDSALSEKVAVLKQDNELLKKIEAARQSRKLVVTGKRGFNIEGRRMFKGDSSLYRDAIKSAIGDVEKKNTETLVDRLNSSAIKREIIAAIDDWAGIEEDSSLRKKILDVSVLADPDPLRVKIRNEENWTNREVLFNLAKSADPEKMEASTLLLLADKLHALPEPEANVLEMTHDEFVRKSVATREAILLLERSLPWHQDDFWIHVRLAYMAQYLELVPETSAHFLAAAAIRTHDGYALGRLARPQLLLGRYVAAEATIKRAIELDGPSEGYYRYLGAILNAQARKKGKFSPEAAAAYIKAVELNPTSASANYSVGTCYGTFGKFEECIPFLRKTVELDPSHEQALNNLASALHSLGRNEEAEKTIRPMVEQPEGTFELGYLTFGEILMALEKFDEAKKQFEHILVLAKEDHGPKPLIPIANESIANCDRFSQTTVRFLKSPEDVNCEDALVLIEFYQENHIRKERVAKLYRHILENRIDEIKEENLKTHRYNAACAAINTDASNEEWREFAHVQLTKLLDESGSAIESFPEEETERDIAKSAMAVSLKHWEGDTDLVPIRDNLETLIVSERKRWKTLWKQHSELLLRLKVSDRNETN